VILKRLSFLFYLLGISLKNPKTVREGFDNSGQSNTTLRNGLWLAKGICNLGTCVNASVELELQLLLGHLHQEVANSFWHCVANVSEDNLEVGVNSGSDFLDENILRAQLFLVLLHSLVVLVLLVLRRKTVAVLVVLGDLLLGGNNARAVLLVVQVVCEKIVLFTVDDCFNNFPCVITFV
jgi:hypothetical protein